MSKAEGWGKIGWRLSGNYVGMGEERQWKWMVNSKLWRISENIKKEKEKTQNIKNIHLLQTDSQENQTNSMLRQIKSSQPSISAKI